MTDLRAPEVDDAIEFIVNFVRAGRRGTVTLQGYGGQQYDVYIPVVLRAYLIDAGEHPDRNDPLLWKLSPSFYAAAWELCRRGILRPGITNLRLTASDDGSGGNGYSITPYGKTWVEKAHEGYVPVEPGRFAAMLADTGERFGPGFIERAQEAVTAYNAHAYLACCAMCGAATESVILALAIKKLGNEERVLEDYSSRGGRGRVENAIRVGTSSTVQNEFRRYTDLLKYWRDSAAHGRAVQITEAEAYTSMTLLLRFAIYAADHWADFTK